MLRRALNVARFNEDAKRGWTPKQAQTKAIGATLGVQVLDVNVHRRILVIGAQVGLVFIAFEDPKVGINTGIPLTSGISPYVVHYDLFGGSMLGKLWASSNAAGSVLAWQEYESPDAG